MFPHLRPSHPVLICNPWSGGGKVAKFDLVKKAEALGVEVILLDHGLDLEVLARDAVARGADCLGMAGGDGSQALVASIAIEHGLPFVCISAGTRNHFALDLGLDRDDPSTGLVAFTEGVIRRIDYARVGSRLFVNNVSLGVYAQIVEQDAYRGAKLATTMESLPELLGAHRRNRSTCSSRLPTARRWTGHSSSSCPTTPTSWVRSSTSPNGDR